MSAEGCPALPDVTEANSRSSRIGHTELVVAKVVVSVALLAC
jgi:hypothetical protein